MDKETANALILKLWTVQEQLTSIQSFIDNLEQAIADEVKDNC